MSFSENKTSEAKGKSQRTRQRSDPDQWRDVAAVNSLARIYRAGTMDIVSPAVLVLSDSAYIFGC